MHGRPRFRFGPAPGSGEVLRCFCLLPLPEPKPSNNDLIARRSVSESEELGWQLTPLVVVFLLSSNERGIPRWKQVYHATPALFLFLSQICTRCSRQRVTGRGKVPQQPCCSQRQRCVARFLPPYCHIVQTGFLPIVYASIVGGSPSAISLTGECELISVFVHMRLWRVTEIPEFASEFALELEIRLLFPQTFPKFSYLFREGHRTPFTDLPHLRLCTSTFRFFQNSEPAMEASVSEVRHQFKDAYRRVY